MIFDEARLNKSEVRPLLREITDLSDSYKRPYHGVLI